jgi:hypothetical protein
MVDLYTGILKKSMKNINCRKFMLGLKGPTQYLSAQFCYLATHLIYLDNKW